MTTRITSTYVENTYKLKLEFAPLQDHLHIRGEYSIYFLIALVAIRITSTYVENTPSAHNQFRYIKDHLHIRGEYYCN